MPRCTSKRRLRAPKSLDAIDREGSGPEFARDVKGRIPWSRRFSVSRVTGQRLLTLRRTPISFGPDPGIIAQSFVTSALSSSFPRGKVEKAAHSASPWRPGRLAKGCRARGNGKALMRLLIAEDDKALGLFLSRGLEADGHRVRLAYDGGAAVEAFRQDMPDLTILDLNMPVKDGEQVLKEVRSLDANLPVLVLTGRQEVDTRVRCLDRGADDLMTKPFSLHELRAPLPGAAQAQAGDTAAVARGRPGTGPAGSQCAARRAADFADQQGVCIARTPAAQPRRVRLAGGTAGLGVESGAGADHQHRRCVYQLSSPQAGGSAAGPLDSHGAWTGLHGALGGRTVGCSTASPDAADRCSVCFPHGHRALKFGG